MSDTPTIAELAGELRRLIARLDAGEAAAPRWLSVRAAAKYAGVSHKSVRNLIAAGRLPASRAVRGRVLIARDALDALLVAGCDARPRRGRGIRQGGAP